MPVIDPINPCFNHGLICSQYVYDLDILKTYVYA